MVQVGDKVLVNHSLWNIHNKLMKVIEATPTDPQMISYYGDNHIVVEDEKGNNYVLHTEDYIVSDSANDTESNEITAGSIITINDRYKDKGTRKLFYPVVQVYDGGVSFYNDAGFRKTLPEDRVKKANLNDWFDYFNNLDERLKKLESLTEHTLDLIKNDIENSLHSFRN